MRDFHERKKLRHFLHSPVLSAILFVMVLLLLKSNYSVYKTNQTARINREEADKKLVALQDRSARLTDALLKLGTDRGIEEELRDKYQVMKIGEEVLVVVDSPNMVTQTESVAEASANRGVGLWQRVMSFFGF